MKDFELHTLASNEVHTNELELKRGFYSAFHSYTHSQLMFLTINHGRWHKNFLDNKSSRDLDKIP